MRVTQTAIRKDHNCTKVATRRSKVCAKNISTQFSQQVDGIFDRTFDPTFN